MPRFPQLLALFVGCALLAGRSVRAEGASEEARNFRIESGESTRSVRVGEKGRVVLLVRPVGDTWHVNRQAPLKLHLDAPAGLKLDRNELENKDATDPKAGAPRFEVPFLARAAGRHEMHADFDFYLCSDKDCLRQTQRVTIPVEVR